MSRHERVQESTVNSIDFISLSPPYAPAIGTKTPLSAALGFEFVPAREWMRICVELLDLLKAHKRAVCRAAVNSFGYIAKSLGPQDILQVLLTNLPVQERQSRVCSTAAIGIVTETCGHEYSLHVLRSPMTNRSYLVLQRSPASSPFSMNTERQSSTSEAVVQKPCRICIHADSVVTVLEDALADRDLVHRQTASTILKHTTLWVAGLGCEDSMLHSMNLVWPNCFETSPHVIGVVLGAIDAMRVTLGAGILLSYVLHGLLQPARKVRGIRVVPIVFNNSPR